MIAARTDLGTRRAAAAVTAIVTLPGDNATTIAQVIARTAESDREARRIAETVRSLSAERDRIAMRIDGVEREMGDLTGSISKTLQNNRQDRQPTPEPAPVVPPAATQTPAQIPPPAAPAMASSMAPAAKPQSPLSNSSLMHMATPAPLDPKAARAGGPMISAPEPVATTEPAAAPKIAPTPIAAPAPETVAVPAPPLVATENIPLPRPSPLNAQRPEASATPEPAAADTTASTTVASAAEAKTEPQPKVEIGIDLGPALSMARLRTRWDAFRKSQGPAADGMRPLVSVRETAQNKPVEMRLVVGPLADVSAAAQLCASLAGSQFPCQPAVFDGQRLALH